MPYFDLNVLYTGDISKLINTISFLHQLNYTCIAINFLVNSLKDVKSLQPPIPLPDIPGIDNRTLRLLTRCTILLSTDTIPLLKARIPHLLGKYDLLSLRPTDESTFMAACTTLPPSIISINLANRLPFHTNSKHAAVSAAFKRGCRFEISYAVGTTPLTMGNSSTSSNNSHELAQVRRNLICNASALIRVLRSGKGIILSSGANCPQCCRSPADVVNLACVWGLPVDRAWEALSHVAAGEYVQAERDRRNGWRGVIKLVEDDNLQCSP